MMEGVDYTMALAGCADQYLARVGFNNFQRTKQSAPLIPAYARSKL
jgi:hypothetical protein